MWLFIAIDCCAQGADLIFHVKSQFFTCLSDLLFLFFLVELMLLGLISLLLAQWARWISEICVDSSLFSSRFYICSEQDYGVHEHIIFGSFSGFLNESDAPHKKFDVRTSHQCGEV